MTAKDIILAIEGYYGMSNNALASELGVNHTRIDNLVNGVTKSITKQTAALLLSHFPTLNPDFVIKGHEPMHIKKRTKDFTRLTTAEMMNLIMQQYQILSPAAIAHKIGWRTNIISAIRKGEQYKQFTVERVKDICKAFPEINPKWLLAGYGNMFKGSRVIDPTLPMPAPVRTNKRKNVTAEASTPTKEEPKDTHTEPNSQAQINAAILEELRLLREELSELRNDRAGIAAETPHKD